MLKLKKKKSLLEKWKMNEAEPKSDLQTLVSKKFQLCENRI